MRKKKRKSQSRETQPRTPERREQRRNGNKRIETVCRHHRIRMFVLIWGILLSSGASVWGERQCQQGKFCITLSDADISAEAGLCVVIPCSFTTATSFTPKHIVWYKCKPSNQKCDDSDMIFHTNKQNTKVQSLFKGRLSLLERDVSQGNCSIIINDLTESDSGAYQLRVNGLLQKKMDGYTYTERAVLSVKALTQKPSVMIPPLTEGQQTTLTCTAPGLCSGSDPKFTWTWRGAGEKDSQITGNITAFKTENLTAVSQSHSSTLTFNVSAEHHSSNVTCEVSFRNNMSAEETVTLNVTYFQKPVITGVTTVKEGDDLNLTCSVERFPPALITWTKHGSNGNLTKETKIILHNDTGTLIISNMTAEYSGLYVCTAKVQIPTLSTHAEVNVTFVKKPVITGNTTIKDGDDLNLTCSVESFPPFVITWTKHGSFRNLTKETKIILHNNTGTATLIIPNVTVDYSGLYVCKAKHQIPTLSTHAEVNVTFLPRILSTSGCVVQSEVLTCVCVSEGIPLPTIKWPLLDTHTEYSVTTNFSNHAFHISITVTLKDRNYTTVECVSRNDIGEVKENLTVTRKEVEQKPKADQHGPSEVLLWIGVAAVSLIVNVICIILLMFLWHSRKKVKPNQEDRTYMAIKKTEVSSSDYDVIAQPLNSQQQTSTGCSRR